jgi:hypothetical protein
MSDNETRITRYVGHERFYVTTREGASKPYGLRFAGGKNSWYRTLDSVERIIAKRAKQNDAGKKAYPARIKEGIFICACGCNEAFAASYKTRKPKYKDDTHRARSRALDLKAKRERDTKRARAVKRARSAKATGKDTQATRKSSQRAGGVEGRGAGRGEGASPLLASTPNVGLYADTPEPAKTAKRRKVGLPTIEAKP